MKMKNLKGLNEYNNQYSASVECAGYEDAVVVIMDGDNAGVNRVKWVKSVANDCDCDVHTVRDNFIFITSKDSESAGKNLSKFKKMFFEK